MLKILPALISFLKYLEIIVQNTPQTLRSLKAGTHFLPRGRQKGLLE